MVKYADGPTTGVEVEIGATPDRIWRYISDINVPGQFSTEFQRAEWIDDPPAVGATFRGFNKNDYIGEWNVICTVTDYEPGHAFEWIIGEPDFTSARWRFEVAPTDSGSTLRFTATMGPGPSGLTIAIERRPDREEDIVARRLQDWTDNMQRTIDGIKDLAESANE